MADAEVNITDSKVEAPFFVGNGSLLTGLFPGTFSALTGVPDFVEEADTYLWDKNAGDDFNGDYNSLTNKPTIPEGVSSLPWANITDKPTIPEQVSSLPWSNITDKPTIPDAVTSLPYANITGTPSIPVNLSQLLDDVGFLLPADLAGYALTSTLANYVLISDTTSWDKNSADDFSGVFGYLAGIPDIVYDNETGAWDKNAADDITEEVDPIFDAAVAENITAQDIINWNDDQTSSGAAATTVFRNMSYVEVYEEFLGDTVNTWWTNTGTQSVSSDTGIVGVYNFATNTSVGGESGFSFGRSGVTSTNQDYAVPGSYLEVRAKLVAVTGQNFMVGFLRTSTQYNYSTVTQGAYFNWTNGTANFTAVTQTAAATSTSVDTGVPVVANGYYKFAINAQTTYVEFFINDTLRANITTTIPTTQYVGVVGTVQESVDTTADNHRIDYIYWRRLR